MQLFGMLFHDRELHLQRGRWFLGGWKQDTLFSWLNWNGTTARVQKNSQKTKIWFWSVLGKLTQVNNRCWLSSFFTHLDPRWFSSVSVMPSCYAVHDLLSWPSSALLPSYLSIVMFLSPFFLFMGPLNVYSLWLIVFIKFFFSWHLLKIE